jgi:hypothetical protein
METAATLTDVIGPRLTGSPAQRRASEWARQKLSEWGLSNARLETWGTVIMAAFAWNAANREALLPRKPLPKP